MNQITNVISTLLHLQIQINYAVEALNGVYMNKEVLNNIYYPNSNGTRLGDSTNALISNYTIMPFCSFLEEYNKYFVTSNVEPEFKERVSKVRKINKPGIKRINKWNDLINFRNELVAHSFKIKRFNKESFFSEDIEKIEYKIPNKNSEKNLFNEIIKVICHNIRSEFPEIIENIVKKDMAMLDKISIVDEKVDFESELAVILAEMNIKRERKTNYLQQWL